jgi:hypothetical protein
MQLTAFKSLDTLASDFKAALITAKIAQTLILLVALVVLTHGGKL